MEKELPSIEKRDLLRELERERVMIAIKQQKQAQKTVYAYFRGLETRKNEVPRGWTKTIYSIKWNWIFS